MIHIAGFPLRVGRKGRQLCAWCGALLFSEDADAEAWVGERPKPWEIGGLVRVLSGNGATISAVVSAPEDGRLPVDACAPHAPLPRPAPFAVKG